MCSLRGRPLRRTNAASGSCLFIAPQWVGDAVMSQPLLADLAERGPVDVLCNETLTELFAHMPGARRVLPARFQRGALELSERRRWARELTKAGYERAVVCPNSWKSALIPWLARIPHRRGLLGEMRLGLINQRRRPLGPSQPEAYAALADHPARALETKPQITPPGRLTGSLAWFSCAGRRLALCPGAEFGPAKQWPAEHAASLARMWIEAGGSVMTLGTQRDQEIESRIQTSLFSGLEERDRARFMPRAGQTSLGEAIALLSEADAVVSNDSGLMHAAAALGRPTLGLYGSSDPRRTPLRGAHSTSIWLGLDCSPCLARSCPLGTLACLEQIAPGRVRATLEDLMHTDP
ncbi:MAG: lipopolysaccharide heptosyltransferase II [Betaproteobacteria bacterium]|nr:lipopolysaccharide heptosyltransferase II [Betaproteobacteria bacterium]